MIEEKYEGNVGIITFRKCGNLANAFRRILLDEIVCWAFDTSDAKLETSDTLLTHDVLTNIPLVRILESHEGGANVGITGKFYISVKSVSDNSPVLSDNILDERNKPAPVVPGLLICHLGKDCHLDIKNITLSRGIGREHAKFCATYGRISYEDLDTTCVNYINERGFNEIRTVEGQGLEKSVIYSEAGRKLMSESTKNIVSKYTDITSKYKNPVFLDTCSYESQNYRIRFTADNPRAVFATARKQLAGQLQERVMTKTTLEVLRWFCYAETICPIFVSHEKLTIVVAHDNAARIMENAIKTIMKIINH